MPSREEGLHGPSVAAVDVARDLLGVRWTPPARDKGAKRPRGSNEGAKRQGVSGRGSEAAVRPSVGWSLSTDDEWKAKHGAVCFVHGGGGRSSAT